MGYYPNQGLTGDSCFQTYLAKVKIEEDSAEHTLFWCRKWANKRETTRKVIDHLSPESLVTTLTEDEESWILIIKIMKKEEIETIAPP